MGKSRRLYRSRGQNKSAKKEKESKALDKLPHPTQRLDQLFVVAFLDLVADAADEEVSPYASGPKRIPDFREAEALEVGDVDGDEFRDAMEDEA